MMPAVNPWAAALNPGLRGFQPNPANQQFAQQQQQKALANRQMMTSMFAPAPILGQPQSVRSMT